MLAAQRFLVLTECDCFAALEAITTDPKSGKSRANSLLFATEQRCDGVNLWLIEPVFGATEPIVRARNLLAFTLMQCAIYFANATEKWISSQEILETARKYAIYDQLLLNQITHNLDIAAENALLYGDGKITWTPWLTTVNGCGFALYGEADQHPETGSYIATYYFVMFFVPIFPIARYRVIKDGAGSTALSARYLFLNKAPLRPLDKCHAIIGVAVLLVLFCCLCML